MLTSEQKRWDRRRWVGLGMGAVHKVAVVAGSRKALVKSPNYLKVW